MKEKRAANEGRLFLALPTHEAFYDALRDRAAGNRGRMRVPVVGRKRALYLRKRAVVAILCELANSPSFLSGIAPDDVPPMIRRLAAVTGKPTEYYSDGSLFERSFGILPPENRPRASRERPIEWEASQPHRLERSPTTDESLPQPAKRELTVWQASVIAFCWADYTGKQLGVAPTAAYCLFRDWLIDQVKVSLIDGGMRVAASRLLSWFCGGADESLDACASRVPPEPCRATSDHCLIVRARARTKALAIHPIQPTTEERHGRPVNWLPFGSSEPHVVMEFDRERVDPIRLRDALAECAKFGSCARGFKVEFDATLVHLILTQKLWNLIMFQVLPSLAIGIRVGRMMMTSWSKLGARPLAPFFATAYLHHDEKGAEIAARGLLAFLFGVSAEVAGGDPKLLALMPSVLNRYEDVVARMRRGYRADGVERHRPGFYSALIAMRARHDNRIITGTGCRRLPSSPACRAVSRLVVNEVVDGVDLKYVEPGDVWGLYSVASPSVFEEIVQKDDDVTFFRDRRPFESEPRAAVAARLNPARRALEAQRSSDDAGERIPQFVRALYEAERLASVPLASRGDEDAAECQIETDWEVVMNGEIAKGLPAKWTFPVLSEIKKLTDPDDIFFSAHPDAAPCIELHPVTRVRVLAEFETATDLEKSVELRTEPGDQSPRWCCLEEYLDDRSDGRTKSFGEAWRAVNPMTSLLTE
jgi:hypothetical protein